MDVAEARIEAAARGVAPPDEPHEPPPLRRLAGRDAPPSANALDSIAAAPMTYPDDAGVSKLLRKLDDRIGNIEQGGLFAVLVVMVLVGGINVLLEKLFHFKIWFAEDVVSAGTFWMATFGAAFATQQQRHLAMDLLSKQFSPRGRLVLAAILEVATIAVALLMVKYGLRLVDVSQAVGGRHIIELPTIVAGLAFASGLIAIHAALHLTIHIDYIARGKLPPERMRSAH